MNWRRGFLLAAVNLAVAVPQVVWLDWTEHLAVQEHEQRFAAQRTPEPAPISATQVSFDICNLTDRLAPQAEVVVFANLPANVPSGWQTLCPAHWTFAGMLHTGGGVLTRASIAAQPKVDAGFILLIAVQWILVGGFPLTRSRQQWSEPGVFITICAVLSAVLVFIHPIAALARLPTLSAVCAWCVWLSLLTWKIIRSAWRWTAMRVITRTS